MHVLETCTYKVMFQSLIYYLASPVWQFIICVSKCCICTVLHCVHDYMHTAKQKLDLWNELDSLVHSIKTQSGRRNIRLLRSHRQKYSYTNTPLRKAVKAHLLLSVEKCNLKKKQKKTTW